MPSKIRIGQALVYMKVGTHAQESLEDIVTRKRREIEEAGFALWGYGGSTCHPVTMVQPFARSYIKRSGSIYLVMQPMPSKHFAEPVRAREYSVDGIDWEKIDSSINVLGSRYALAIRDLHQEEFGLDLSNTAVAIGNSTGRNGRDYIRGQVDKACLEVTGMGADASKESPSVQIGLVATIVEPYAVFVRE